MKKEQVLELAKNANMSVDELVDGAMLAVMVGDPHDSRYALAWGVWTVGQEVLADLKRSRRTPENGWRCYQHQGNSSAIDCPFCGAPTYLTGGRNPIEYCARCDARAIEYDRDGTTGVTWRRWIRLEKEK